MANPEKSTPALKTFTPALLVKPKVLGFVLPRFVELAEPWVRYPESPTSNEAKNNLMPAVEQALREVPKAAS